MARVARLLRSWPELTILLKGISIAARSVLSTLCLLLVLVYVFAMAFRQLTNNTAVGHKYFRSVPFGMKVLLLKSALPDGEEIVNALGNENVFYAFVGVAFMGLSGLTIMNMLIGVLCEVIGVVSAVEKEAMQVNFVKSELLHALKENHIRVDEDLIISKQDFHTMLTNPAFAKSMKEVGVDPLGLLDVCDFIFSGECQSVRKSQLKQGLRFHELIELMLDLGGGNACRVKDVIDLRKVLLSKFEQFDVALRRQSSLLQQVSMDVAMNKQSHEDKSCDEVRTARIQGI